MLASAQAENYRDGHKEDPYVQNDIDDVRGVSEGDFVDADSLDGSPPGCYRPTTESQGDLHAQKPYCDHCCCPSCKPTKERGSKDAMVECENRKLCSGDGNVVEVAEDIIPLYHVMWLDGHSEGALCTDPQKHGHILLRDSFYVSPKAIRSA